MDPDPRNDAERSIEDDSSATSHAQELSRLFEQHNQALHAFLMTRVRDAHEAREIAQEAYVRVLQLHKPGAVSFLRAYLFKTAANLALNRLRQRNTRGRLDSMVVEEAIDLLSPERWVMAEEEIDVLARALFELPPKARQAFVLHRFREWEVQRIARELEVSSRMVRHYLFQAGLYCKLRIRGLSASEAREQLQR